VSPIIISSFYLLLTELEGLRTNIDADVHFFHPLGIWLIRASFKSHKLDNLAGLIFLR
jgi:Ni,Fe-hydrogenase I cytochrome b subunit